MLCLLTGGSGGVAVWRCAPRLDLNGREGKIFKNLGGSPVPAAPDWTGHPACGVHPLVTCRGCPLHPPPTQLGYPHGPERRGCPPGGGLARLPGRRPETSMLSAPHRRRPPRHTCRLRAERSPPRRPSHPPPPPGAARRGIFLGRRGPVRSCCLYWAAWGGCCACDTGWRAPPPRFCGHTRRCGPYTGLYTTEQALRRLGRPPRRPPPPPASRALRCGLACRG